MNEEKISPGAYLQQRITERSRKVAKSNNAAGYVAMWPEAVKEVLAKSPNLSSDEKAALRGNVDGQIHSMGGRTHQDFTAVLQAVARFFGWGGWGNPPVSVRIPWPHISRPIVALTGRQC